MKGTLRAYPPPLLKRLPADIADATSNSAVKCGSPPSTRAVLAVVPPMSNVMALSTPNDRASPLEAITPAAGPDSTTYAGRSAAASLVMTPPLDCMMSNGAVTPNPSSFPRSASR